MEIEKELQKFDLPTAVIEKMAEQYLPLKIKDLADKEGYRSVREARLTVKDKRVGVEKRRKELKEDSLRFGKAVDAEAKRITALLEPIETHLEAQEGRWDAEKERIKQEAIKQEQMKLQVRVDALRQYNCSVPVAVLQAMSDDDYDWTLEEAKTDFEIAENARIAAEKERLEAERLEAERLEAVRIEQEAERLRLKERLREMAEISRAQTEKEAILKQEQDRLTAEKKSIEDAEKERLRKIDENKVAAELERVRLKELEEAKIAAAEQERVRIQTEAEKQRLEAERQRALLPDKEKLAGWMVEINDIANDMPTLKDKNMGTVAESAKERLIGVVAYLQGWLL